MTYSEAANLAVNQTLMRSINTSLIALLPVAGLLFVGAGLLGVGTLKDLALVLFVGLAAGAYSSIFLATPIVADLKEREPEYKALRQAGRSPAGRRRGRKRRAAAVPAGRWPAPAERAAAGLRRGRRARACPARSRPTSSSSRRPSVRREPGPAGRRRRARGPPAAAGPSAARRSAAGDRSSPVPLAELIAAPRGRRPGLPRAGHRSSRT